VNKQPKLAHTWGAIAAALVLAGGGWLAVSKTGHTSRPVPWRDLTSELGPVRWPRLTISVLRNPEKLPKILAIVTPPGERVPKPPLIDFRHRIGIVFAPGPRSSTGYDVRVARIVDEGDRISIHFREITPTLREHVTAKLTYPYRLITIPRTTKHLRFVMDGRP
jgi:hypothetical protein